MQFLKSVLTRISTGTPGFVGATPGIPASGKSATTCKIGLSISLAANRSGLRALGHRGRQICRFGRQNNLYGLHCDRDTARLVSVFAKGTMHPTIGN